MIFRKRPQYRPLPLPVAHRELMEVGMWINEMPAYDGLAGFACPRCESVVFTVTLAPHGITLACWSRPTFIGVRT